MGKVNAKSEFVCPKYRVLLATLASSCLLASNSHLNGNERQGGVVMMSSDKEMWEDGSDVDPVERGYGVALMRNSNFTNNTASSDNGGVANLEKFATLSVQGDGNSFVGNTAEADGSVFSSTTSTSIYVDGGIFVENESESVRVEAMPRGRRDANDRVALVYSTADSSAFGFGVFLPSI